MSAPRPSFFRRRPARATALAAVLATAATLFTAPGAQSAPGAPAERPDHRPQAPSALRGPALERWVQSVIAGMSLEERVGQLFTTVAYGTDANTPDPRNTELYGVDTPAEVVEKYHLGGMIYFNWTDSVKGGPQQIAQLSNGLQQAAVTSGARLPLMISTDQEYGLVTRIGPPATQFPGAMALGATRSTDLARQAAAIGGRELRAMGINQNFSPVADVNVNPANPVIGVRSFSSSPQLAGELSAAQVKGYQRDAGIAAAAKHFPGHGDTETDSHTGIPEITHTKEEWDRIDAPPFRAAIDAGIDVVMTGHLVMPHLDPTETPGTLSEPILGGLLREELGYDGVVITDSLQMDGVREKYGDDRIPVMALNAGADVLLMPQDMDTAFQAVLDAVHSGEVSMERIEESLTRVLKLKVSNGVLARPFVDESQVERRVGNRRHLTQAQEITDHTTTVVKNDADLLPFADAPGSLLVTGPSATPTEALASAATERGTPATGLVTGTQPTDAQIAEAVSQAGEHEVTVVLTERATHPASDPELRQTKLVEALLATGQPVVVAAVRDPYDIANFTAAPTFLATYSTTAVAMEALAGVLYGENVPSGRLPVAIPTADDPQSDLYPYGHGLSW